MSLALNVYTSFLDNNTVIETDGDIIKMVGYRNLFELTSSTLNGDIHRISAVKNHCFMSPNGSFVKLGEIRKGAFLKFQGDLVCRVESIEPKGRKQVCSVEMKSTTSYVANGFICANFRLKRCCPLTSYGVIAFRHDPENMSKFQILLIRRKFTMGFMDLIRGRYYNMDVHTIVKTFLSEMTYDEHDKLKSQSFDELWNMVWNQWGDQKLSTREHLKAKRKYINIPIHRLLNEHTGNLYDTPEYGFPKGRKNINEIDMNCAKREFEEETGLKSSQYYLLIAPPTIEEVFVASNGVLYRHKYYLARVHQSEPEPSVDYDRNPSQIEEIGAVEWRNVEECGDLFRPYDFKKKKVIDDVRVYLSKIAGRIV